MSGEINQFAPPNPTEGNPNLAATPDDHSGVLGRVNQVVEGYKAWAEDHPYAATAVETVALFGIRKMTESALNNREIPTGNALREDHLQSATHHPFRAAVKACIAAPVIEELTYRGILGIPAARAREHGNIRAARAADTAVSLGFAAGHAGLARPAQSWARPPFVRLSKENVSLPLPQLAGGLNYQRLKNKRGLPHSIFAHIINNTLYSVGALPDVLRRRKT